MKTSFGDLLKERRLIRRYSQLQLSLEAEISARHLSFLESGRAQPSRAMVVKLASALNMPKDTTNNAMHAAGFTSAFPELERKASDLAPVYDAVTHMLTSHDPFPAVAIDRHWDLVNANTAALALFTAAGLTGAANMIDALCAAGESDVIENWAETTVLALIRLRAEIVQLGGDRILERYAKQLNEHPRLANADISNVDFSQAVIPTVFNISGTRLSVFSTIANFSTVQDVATSDIRVEFMFPIDEVTRAYFENRLN